MVPIEDLHYAIPHIAALGVARVELLWSGYAMDPSLSVF
jgi:hypothetical protein